MAETSMKSHRAELASVAYLTPLDVTYFYFAKKFYFIFYPKGIDFFQIGPRAYKVFIRYFLYVSLKSLSDVIFL